MLTTLNTVQGFIIELNTEVVFLTQNKLHSEQSAQKNNFNVPVIKLGTFLILSKVQESGLYSWQLYSCKAVSNFVFVYLYVSNWATIIIIILLV